MLVATTCRSTTQQSWRVLVLGIWTTRRHKSELNGHGSCRKNARTERKLLNRLKRTSLTENVANEIKKEWRLSKTLWLLRFRGHRRSSAET
jgi:hypothetical protein